MTKTHADASPSSSEIWIECPASVTKARGRKRLPTIYTTEGSVAHMIAEAVLNGTKRKHLQSQIEYEGQTIQVNEEMLNAVDLYVNYVRGIASGNELHVETKVHVSVAGEELYGTSDAFVIDAPKKAVEVVDFKYGQGVWVPPDTSQFRIYGLGVLDKIGPFLDIEYIVLTVVQPRIDPDPRSVILSVAELVQWGHDTLKPALEKLAANDPTETPGDWCRWCVRAGECAALAARAQAVARTSFDVLPPEPASLSDEALAVILDQAELISSWVIKVRAEASQRLDQGGEIPGWKLVQKRASRKWTDGTAVIVELVKRGVDVMDIVRVETLTHVEAVMKRKKIPGTVIAPYTVKESSGTTLVSDKDPRNSVDTSAKGVFGESSARDYIESDL